MAKQSNMEKNENASLLGKLSAEARDTSSKAMKELALKRWDNPKNELTIQKGWYWSAGSTYGWGEDHSREGIGINRDALLAHPELLVHVKTATGKTSFKVDTNKAIEFIRAHKSFKTLGTTKVGFIPRTLMQEL